MSAALQLDEHFFSATLAFFVALENCQTFSYVQIGAALQISGGI